MKSEIKDNVLLKKAPDTNGTEVLATMTGVDDDHRGSTPDQNRGGIPGFWCSGLTRSGTGAPLESSQSSFSHRRHI
jgi:hypothetical protein